MAQPAYAHVSHNRFDLYSKINTLEEYARKHNDIYLINLIKKYKRANKEEFRKYRKHIKHHNNKDKGYHHKSPGYHNYEHRNLWYPRQW